MRKLKRLSRKEYKIITMERTDIIPRSMGEIMRKNFSTEDVERYFDGMVKTRFGRKKLKGVI